MLGRWVVINTRQNEKETEKERCSVKNSILPRIQSFVQNVVCVFELYTTL